MCIQSMNQRDLLPPVTWQRQRGERVSASQGYWCWGRQRRGTSGPGRIGDSSSHGPSPLLTSTSTRGASQMTLTSSSFPSEPVTWEPPSMMTLTSFVPASPCPYRDLSPNHWTDVMTPSFLSHSKTLEEWERSSVPTWWVVPCGTPVWGKEVVAAVRTGVWEQVSSLDVA